MKKIIFVHIPKNGGCSIGAALNSKINICIDHNTRNPNYKYLKDCTFPKDRFIFCFARNPWDRIVSSYFFLKHGGHIDFPEDKSDFNFHFGSFSSFKDMLLNWSDSFYKQIHFKPQYQWICDDAENMIPDYIGRFENFQEDFAIVCDKIGVPRQQLPHINKSEHKHYTEYYDDETRQIVAEKYAKDIKYFGYKFGE